MTARRDLKSRMTVAATRRAEPELPAAGQTAVRTKPIRVTLDLSPADYEALNRWVGSAAVAADPDFPRLSLARALRAMIHATIKDEVVAAVVVDLLRRERGKPSSGG